MIVYWGFGRNIQHQNNSNVSNHRDGIRCPLNGWLLLLHFKYNSMDANPHYCHNSYDSADAEIDRNCGLHCLTIFATYAVMLSRIA